ncbi:MAG: 5-formyltetrahydrofolate cyclo-ligase [Alphaproteobacteria bacterium]
MDATFADGRSAPPTGPVVERIIPSIGKAKRELRAAARARRAELGAERGATASSAVVSRFLETEALAAEVIPDHAVAGYAPINDELDPTPLLRRLGEAGMTTALPVTAGKDRPLVFRRWAPGDRLVTGEFAVPVPDERAPEITPALILVPMLAFDRRGNRLGYGAGYYDRTLRFLRRAGRLTAVGLAFADQLVDAVPATDDDERLDWIVTEAGARPIC